MTYDFKVKPETVFFILQAIVTAVLLILVDFNASDVDNWPQWFVLLGSAALRAGAGAGLALLGYNAITDEVED